MTLRAAFLALCAAVLAACGTSGEAPAPPPPTASTPAPAEQPAAAPSVATEHRPPPPAKALEQDAHFGVKTIDPPVELPGRRHRASARALALVRRGDAVAWRPTDHGLRAVRCDVEMTATIVGMGKSVYRAKYAMTAPGKSSLTLVSQELAERMGMDWNVDLKFGPGSRCKATLDDLFDGPRLERLVEGYELEMREEKGKTFVLARRAPGETGDDTLDLRFADDGTLAQDGPGDRAVHPFCSSRRTFKWKAQDGLFLRASAVLFDESRGFEQFKYETIGGVLVPVRHARTDSGMIESIALTNVEVNPPDLVGGR